MEMRPERDALTTWPGPGSVSESLEEVASLTSHQRRLFDVVADQPNGLTVAEMAVLVSTHHNTVRGHLEVLEGRGLVRSSHRVPSGRGRPSRIYRSTVPPPRLPWEYLASLVHSLVETISDEAARALGRRWAASLIAEERFDPHTPTPLIEFESLLNRTGFSPVVRVDCTIELGSCPFVQPGTPMPSGVCALHRGTLEALTAALARSRPALGNTRVELHPHSGRGCTVRIGATPGAPGEGDGT